MFPYTLDDDSIESTVILALGDLGAFQHQSNTLPPKSQDGEPSGPVRVVTTMASSKRADARPMVSLPTGVTARLEIAHADGAESTVVVDQPVVTIGRSRGCNVRLADSSASGAHAMISFSRARQWRIRDLDSTNGTRLNGCGVGEFVLESGDELLVGQTRIRFEVSEQ